MAGLRHEQPLVGAVPLLHGALRAAGEGGWTGGCLRRLLLQLLLLPPPAMPPLQGWHACMGGLECALPLYEPWYCYANAMTQQCRLQRMLHANDLMMGMQVGCAAHPAHDEGRRASSRQQEHRRRLQQEHAHAHPQQFYTPTLGRMVVMVVRGQATEIQRWTNASMPHERKRKEGVKDSKTGRTATMTAMMPGASLRLPADAPPMPTLALSVEAPLTPAHHCARVKPHHQGWQAASTRSSARAGCPCKRHAPLPRPHGRQRPRAAACLTQRMGKARTRTLC